jgi:AbrB family looped-hinge helix DNA binding protein
MPISTISAKGQITLPARMRRKLGIKTHGRVVVEMTEDAIVIKPASDLFALEGFAGKALAAEEEKACARKAATDRSCGGRP